MLASALRLPSRGTQEGPGRSVRGQLAARGVMGGFGRARVRSGGQEQSGGQRAWACCCPSSASVVPVWPQLLCHVLGPGVSLCLQLPMLSQEAAFPVLKAAFLYTPALPMLICSLDWGTWKPPSRLPLDWHPCQAQGG